MVTEGCGARPWRTLALLTCAFLTCTATISDFDTYQGMSPTNPLFATGETLELNCTLSERAGQTYNASSIYFQFQNREIGAEHVTVLSERMAQLRLTPALRNMTGHWFCYMRDGPEKKLGQQVVTIGDLPVMPRITGCVVSNWQDMTCSWEPKVQDTGLVTNQTLYWTLLIFSPVPTYYHCPHLSENTCTWKSLDLMDSFKFGRMYAVFMRAQNQLGSTTTVVHHFNTPELVKPNAVGGLKENITASDKIQLIWKEPEHEKEILYKVTYRPSNSNVWLERNTTSEEMTLTNLSAYTDYTINVACIPGNEDQVVGFWSDSEQIIVKTRMSVPQVVPAVSAGGFRTSDDQRNTLLRKAYIFWQSIPEKLRNGEIEKYRVQHRAVGTEAWETPTYVTDCMAQIELVKETAYEVAVDARTRVGYNESHSKAPTIILIERESMLPPKPEKVVSVALDEHTVMINWTATPGALGYTVYWCPGSSKFWTCEEELQWQVVDENVTSYNLSLGSGGYKRFIFAVAAEVGLGNTSEAGSTGSISGGMKWSECTSRIDIVVIRPQQMAFAEHQKGESISLEWTHPPCVESAYIDKYLIYYCPVTECPAVDVKPEGDAVKEVAVDSDVEDYIITGLTPFVEYRVWMHSHSPYKGMSQPTKGVVITVRRSGFPEWAIAVICLVGIVFLLVILFGLYHSCKTLRKTVKEKVNMKFERPPEVSNHFTKRLESYEEDCEGDYLHNYSMLLGSSDQQAAEQNQLNQQREEPGNGSAEHQTGAYFGSDFSQGRDSGYGGSGKDSVSSNDTVLTLLEHPSSDSLDDVFDGNHSLSRNHSHNSQVRLSTVPEEPDDGLQHPMYETSGASGRSSIPGYSKCGVPTDEEPDTPEVETSGAGWTGPGPGPDRHYYSGHHNSDDTDGPSTEHTPLTDTGSSGSQAPESRQRAGKQFSTANGGIPHTAPTSRGLGRQPDTSPAPGVGSGQAEYRQPEGSPVRKSPSNIQSSPLPKVPVSPTHENPIEMFPMSAKGTYLNGIPSNNTGYVTVSM